MNRSTRTFWLGAALLVAAGAAAVALAQGPMAGGPRSAPADRYDDMMRGYGPGGYGPGGYGPGGYGMMRGHGPGMMGGYGMMRGYGMMGGTGMMQVLPSNAQPLADDAVRSALQRAAAGIAAGAQLHDIMVFTNNVYAQVLDADGNAVAEILLDRYSGAVSPEPGPNMMWSTRFGMTGGTRFGIMRGDGGAYGPGDGYGPGRMGPGMMGDDGYGPGTGGAPAPGVASQTPARYDVAAATDLANTFLAGYLPGATVVGSQSFPGYYTFDYGTGGEPQGMLSVNAASGQVWPHTWHGAFIREMD